MSNFYVDTSALNKRYLNETGSAWVRGWIRPETGNVIFVSQLASVEGFSAFARLRRENIFTELDELRLQNTLLWHLAHEYLVIPVDEAVLTQARQLVDRYPLRTLVRTLDAIHLASAEQIVELWDEAMTFVAADKALLNAAANEGFATDDPNTHPSS